MTDALAALDATAQAELVRSGQASPLELVDAAITRIEKLDHELNAVIHHRFERARAEAAGEVRDGPFRGVPMVLKDLDGYSAGDPCHQGNRLLKAIDWHGDHDSSLVARLRAAGFVFVGKTNAPEFGLMPTTEPLAYGPTHNPWDLARSPGGSSGGSAAAVASGMVPVGHAGDGGGSIRIPASACGLFGLKPTRGRVSFAPDSGESWAGFVVRHAVTRSVRDSAAVLDVLQGAEPGDPYWAPPPARPYAAEVGADPGRLRIGMRIEAPAGMTETHPDCRAAAEATALLLESLGHSVEPAAPAALDEGELLATFLTIMTTAVVHDVELVEMRARREVTADDFEPLTWAYAELGRTFSSIQYLEALNAAHDWSRRMAVWWAGGYDLLLTPTMPVLPPILGELTPPPDEPLLGATGASAAVAWCAPFNVTGQPAVSVPLSWNDAGIPIGSQLVAASGREDLLVRVAAQLEAARPWADRRPPVHA